jgi:hypothetical protein
VGWVSGCLNGMGHEGVTWLGGCRGSECEQRSDGLQACRELTRWPTDAVRSPRREAAIRKLVLPPTSHCSTGGGAAVSCCSRRRRDSASAGGSSGTLCTMSTHRLLRATTSYCLRCRLLAGPAALSGAAAAEAAHATRPEVEARWPLHRRD